MSDALYQELAKLEDLTGSGKSKWPPLATSLDALLARLQSVKEDLRSGETTPQNAASDLTRNFEVNKKNIDERQKEIYNCLGKMGRALDKKFPSAVPVHATEPFISDASCDALERVLATHFLRTGQFETASIFLKESSAAPSSESQVSLALLHDILERIKSYDLQPAIRWAEQNRSSLQRRNSSLEFNLHKLQYLRMLMRGAKASRLDAVRYLQSLAPVLREIHAAEVQRLVTALLYLPFENLVKSPYGDLVDPSLHRITQVEFAKEYCASIGLSRTLPLRTVGDIGAGGAIVRIEKGRKVMREKKSEWSQTDELPIEVPLLPEQHYHSIFACPVSKEQSSEANLPMMMTCGHVLAKESLSNMVKTGGRIKCPYCPESTTMDKCLRVYF